MGGFFLELLPEIDSVLDRLGLSDILKLGCTCKAAQVAVVAYLGTRSTITAKDLPSRNVRSSHIFKTLSLVKQPRSLSLHLKLLPDLIYSASKACKSYGFPSHLGTFQCLVSVTLLLDEPRTSLDEGILESGACSQGMLAPCIEAIALSASPVKTMTLGGLRYPNSAKLKQALQRIAIHKRSIRSLNFIRLDQLTGEDLHQLAPEFEGQAHRKSAAAESTFVDDTLLCLHTTSQERLSDGSQSEISCPPCYSGSSLNSSGSLAGSLQALSIIECSRISDAHLEHFLQYTCSLEQLILVPDDDGAALGHTTPRTLFNSADALEEPASIGPLALNALSSCCSNLRYLYLSEELSPSSFGDEALRPLMQAATNLEGLHLNIPVSDSLLHLVAQQCPLLTAVTLLCSNLTDSALTALFHRCTLITDVTLCGSPYFGSMHVTSAFLVPLLRRSSALTALSLDCMHNVSAVNLVDLLVQALPHASLVEGYPAAYRLCQATLAELDDPVPQAASRWSSASLGLQTLVHGSSSRAASDSLETFGDHATLDADVLVGTRGTEGSSCEPKHLWLSEVAQQRSQSSTSPVPVPVQIGNGETALGKARRACSSGQGVEADSLPGSLPATASTASSPSDSSIHPSTSASSPPDGTMLPSRIDAGPGQLERRWGILAGMKTLNLDNMPKLPEGGVQRLTAVLMQAPNLQGLSLQGYCGPIDAVLQSAVKCCPQLSDLNVGGCRLLTDRGMQSLCQLQPRLISLSMQSCLMVSSCAIQQVLHYHRATLESVDLWGTRACGQQLAKMLANGTLQRVNVGGTLTWESASIPSSEGLLRQVFNDLPLSSGTELSTASPSLLLSQRVMFGPRFHDLLETSGYAMAHGVC